MYLHQKSENLGAIGIQICELKSMALTPNNFWTISSSYNHCGCKKNGHLLCVGEEILKVSLYVGLTQVSINQTGHWSRTWRLFSHLKIQNIHYFHTYKLQSLYLTSSQAVCVLSTGKSSTQFTAGSSCC